MPEMDGLDRWGSERFGIARRQFLLESLHDLQRALKRYDSDLLLLEGNAVLALQELAKEIGAKAILGPSEMAFNEKKEETNLQQWGKDNQVDVRFLLERTLFNRDTLPFGLSQLPETFSRFRNKVEKHCRPELNLPEAEINPIDYTIIDRPFTTIPIIEGGSPLKGGLRAAWEEIDFYFWQSELVLGYKETRNGMLGRDYSSKFSPYLALGCVSPREIYAELVRFEEEVERNESTYWLYFELLWREYFQWIALKHGNELFVAEGMKPELPVKHGFNKKTFVKWKEGHTGDPLVDANMRELKSTGFMSNRGRQNVASYLIHDLGLDWRCGAAWFESQLIDYDPASNYGNWLYIAGRGNDPRPFRKFNTKMQAERYDPEGAYVAYWLD
jgi:deoxyribodipyrimidine photo-lyase